MKKNEIIAKVTTVVNTATIKVKKHSPEILIVAGVVGTVASAVMACKATTKLSTVLEEHKKDVNAVHECSENEEIKADYSQEDAKKDLTIIYAQTGVNSRRVFDEDKKEESVEPIVEKTADSRTVDKPSIAECAAILQREGYVNYSDMQNKKQKQEIAVDRPYVIQPSDFGEFDDYEKISLTYTADGVLLDDSVLEMLIALSIRLEEHIMDDPEIGDRTGQWFWNMITNLGLGSMDDRKFNENRVEDIVTRFLERWLSLRQQR